MRQKADLVRLLFALAGTPAETNKELNTRRKARIEIRKLKKAQKL